MNSGIVAGKENASKVLLPRCPLDASGQFNLRQKRPRQQQADVATGMEQA